MTLIEEAERAEKIGAAFEEFRISNPDHVQDIEAARRQLFALSCALRDTQQHINSDLGTTLHLIQHDLEDVHATVTFTLQDIWTCFSKMGGGNSVPTVNDFRKTWREISRHCLLVGGQSLATRLESYKRFLEALCKALRRQNPDLAELKELREDIRAVRAMQDGSQRLITTMGDRDDLGLGAMTLRSLRPHPSYERERDQHRPMSPPGSGASSERIRDTPWAPSPPLSPAATPSTISQVSSLPSVGNDSKHWAKQVFKHVPSTQLPWTNEQSRYHEDSNVPEQSFPKGYDAVLIFAFPEGLRITLYCRPDDYRAKIVAQYRDYRGQPEFACVPLERLQIRRKGSLLRIGGLRSDDRFLTWVTIKFTTSERLVLFGCTFMAMRSQDGTRHPPAIRDDAPVEEELEFSAPIRDGGYKHGLRVYRDRLSRAIRLQASVNGGELDRTPVWTAFVTHCIASRTWCEKKDRKIVCLADLRPHVFSDKYEPELAPSGAFMLRFELNTDADGFMETIEHLRRNGDR